MTDGPYKLPSGWRWVRLGEVCVGTERRDPSKNPEASFVYVDIAAIDNTEGQIVSPKELRRKEAPSRARKVIRLGDVIFATTRPYLKNIALVPLQLDNQICSTGFCVIRANSELADPKYLFYLCRSDCIVGQLNESKMRGASYPAVTDNDVYESLIPLPPLDEQRRVIARVEALMERVREAKRLRSEARIDSDILLNAAIADAFSEIGTHRLPLVDALLEKPRNGWSPRCDNAPEGTSVLKLGAVLGFRFNPSAVKRTSLPVSPKAHYWLSNGDILISRSNTPELVAHAAIYSGEPNPCIYPDLLMRMRVEPSKADPQFVIYWLQSKEARTYIRAHAMGASSTMKKITQGDVCALPFPGIGVDNQRRIVAYLDSVQDQAAALKRAQEDTDAELRRLEQAILDRAFRGEL